MQTQLYHILRLAADIQELCQQKKLAIAQFPGNLLYRRSRQDGTLHSTHPNIEQGRQR